MKRKLLALSLLALLGLNSCMLLMGSDMPMMHMGDTGESEHE